MVMGVPVCVGAIDTAASPPEFPPWAMLLFGVAAVNGGFGPFRRTETA
jgi:hypothetical protein